jgi:hypothetical protein
MHFYIPQWLCWTIGGGVVLTVAIVLSLVVAVGVGEGNQDIDRMLSEPYPDPRQTGGVEPRSDYSYSRRGSVLDMHRQGDTSPESNG